VDPFATHRRRSGQRILYTGLIEAVNRILTLRIATAVIIAALLAGLLYFTPRLAPVTAKSFTLIWKNDALASGATLMTINQGDTLTLHIQSDRGGQIMIHGYEQELTGHEQELTIDDGGTTTVSFIADKSGRYMVHLHRADQHIEIAQIDIQPR
jgi:hypothetical protein